MFDWDSLRYFNAFVRERSLAAAARSLDVEHATVARRISALESALNIKLVDRRGRLYELTEDGVRVGEYAALMESASFALERFIEGEDNRVEGEVTLSAPPAFLGTMVARRLGELRKRYPLLQLRLVGAKSTASLARKETDIAITFVRPEEQSVVVKSLGTLCFSSYASASYLALRMAADFEFIGYDRSMEQSAQQRWLKDNLKGRRLSVTSNDLRIQALAAAGGAGVVCLPDFLAREYELVEAEIGCPPLELPIWLAFHEDLRSSVKIRVVLDFLMQGLADINAM